MGEHVFKIFVDDNLVQTATSVQLRRNMPGWNVEYTPGDKVLVNGQEKIIQSVKEHFPDTTEQEHVTEVFIK
ncbi:hypothetical protein [Heyndrickxia ginsengihumi]|uniref:hypothetical protein n=1 Tax=Heyndrickxia ginsengihumi TaxID=363870 RepID=UPI000471EE51|nr:hypothetical protein [Heyndrickxia ginsengihumi]